MQNQNTLLDHVTRMPLTVRMRRSAFWERSHLAGAQAYIVYNNMLIATDFMGAEEDYHHLKSAVQIWDVGVERQIEISGPDALRLVQMSTPRDIGKMARDQCFYIPTVDSTGGMSNDPVLLKRDEERYWVSIADSDLILYYKGVAAALGLMLKFKRPKCHHWRYRAHTRKHWSHASGVRRQAISSFSAISQSRLMGEK